jgi:hypothetical protein
MYVIRLSTILLFTLMFIPVDAYSHCKGKHADYKPHCGGGTEPPSSEVDPVYSVEITEFMSGHSGAENWRAGFGGKNAIGLNDALPDGFDVGEITDLELLTEALTNPNDVNFTDSDGAYCFQSNVFPSNFPTGPFAIHQALIKKGKGGRAEGSIWLHGFTKDGVVEVLYVLKLFGQFEPNIEWPPLDGVHSVMMYDWELTIERGSKEITSNSCIGEGETLVVFKVTAES